MIKFACPGCSATFTVGDEKAGKSGKCPKCQSQFVIPGPEAANPTGTDANGPPPLPPEPPTRPSSAGSPAPATDPNQPVEIQPCPKCSTRLSVLPADVGFDIQCPSCETVFKAQRADAPPPPDTGSRSKGSSSLVKLGSGAATADEEDERPSRRRSDRRDDDDDERPSRRRSSRRDVDDDDDYRPRRRRRRGYDDGYVKPHRAGMVLTFSIVGLVLCWNVIGIVFNILAVVFASMDLKEMDNGTMDPAGRGQTSTARTLSIIGLCGPVVLIILYCGFFVLAAGSGGLR